MHRLQGQVGKHSALSVFTIIPFSIQSLLYTIGFQTYLHTRIAWKDFSRICISSPHPRPTEIGSQWTGNLLSFLEEKSPQQTLILNQVRGPMGSTCSGSYTGDPFLNQRSRIPIHRHPLSGFTQGMYFFPFNLGAL